MRTLALIAFFALSCSDAESPILIDGGFAEQQDAGQDTTAGGRDQACLAGDLCDDATLLCVTGLCRARCDVNADACGAGQSCVAPDAAAAICLPD